MTDSLRIQDLLIAPQGPQPGATTPRPAPGAATGATFEQALQQAQSGTASSGLRFSSHAQTRMLSRQISLGAADVQRLEGAVQKAASKGARESLVLLDQTALVVSVPNRTVITVVDKDNLKQNVFTNIDSAVIA